MMKLFFSPGACSLAPHILLNEVGGGYETYKVDLAAKKLANGEDFLKVNPKGQVPTLQTEDGKILTENAVILGYIADTFPHKNVLPANGTWERYKANEWLNFVATEVHKSMGSLFATDRVYPDKAVAEQVKTAIKGLVAKKLDYVNTHLAQNEFLTGKNFCAADAYLFTVLGWSGMLKIDLTPFAHIQTFQKRMMERPAVQRAMQAEGLIKA